MSAKRPADGKESPAKRVDGLELPGSMGHNHRKELWLTVSTKEEREVVTAHGGPRKLLALMVRSQLRHADTTVYIKMSGLRCGKIPDTLTASFPHLRSLSLTGMSLRSIDTAASLPCLTTLSLNSNLLTDMPNCISRFTSLKILNLSRNRLTKLPAALLAPLTSLDTLDCGHNQLRTIESGFFPHLQQLAHLNIEENDLRHTSFPADMAQSPIQQLDINTNMLRRLMPGAHLPRTLKELRGIAHQSPRMVMDLDHPEELPPNLKIDFCSWRVLVDHRPNMGDCWAPSWCNRVSTFIGEPISTAIAVRHLPAWHAGVYGTRWSKIKWEHAPILWQMQQPGSMLTEWLVSDIFSMVVQFVRETDELLPRMPNTMRGSDPRH